MMVTRRCPAPFLFVGLVIAAVLAGLPGTAAAAVPSPTVEHVPNDVGLHGHPLWDSWFDLAAFGYEQHEFFVSGTATETGGGSPAPYTTRIVVAHPSDPADFSGTVMLDWVNVTAQFENAVNTLTSIQFLLREGWAYVHVSAQAAGICCLPGLTPQTFDIPRYAALEHPGDEYANDILSQIAKAFKQPGPVNPLGGLTTDVLIAAGQSQGSIRLTDYVQTTQAAVGLIDGFLLQAEATKQHDANPAAKVIHLLGEREGTPDDPTPWPNYRLWEVAGSAHQDSWIGRQQTEGQSLRIAGAGQRSRAEAEALWESAGNFGEQLDPRENICIVNGALFPTRYASNAALWQLDNWVRTGQPAPHGLRYEFDGNNLAKDEHDNTLGGIRLPPIEHPVATYLADLCNLGGITIPFTEVELLALYGDHATWYERMVAATETSVADGFLLVEDALDLLRRACNARNRFLDTSTGPCEPSPEFAQGEVIEPAPQPQPTAPETGGEPLPSTGGGLAVAAGLVALAATRRRTV